MTVGFGQFLAPQPGQPGQNLQRDLQRKQALLEIGQKLEILKRGGSEAEALIEQLAAEGKAPPDLDQILQTIVQTGTARNVGVNQ